VSITVGESSVPEHEKTPLCSSPTYEWAVPSGWPPRIALAVPAVRADRDQEHGHGQEPSSQESPLPFYWAKGARVELGTLSEATYAFRASIGPPDEHFGRVIEAEERRKQP
jgi:hypothetical protein